MQTENDGIVKNPGEKSSEVKPTCKKPLGQKDKKCVREKSKSDEFKRKYFEFYDDIKISDRQDW